MNLLQRIIPTLTLILLMYCSNVCFSQYSEPLISLPEERVFVHTNGNLFFPGDYLYYKCYVQKNDTGELTDLSKVVYIDIIDQNKKIVFQQTLFLDKGMAFGDFFINESIETGNYTMFAYTNWMKNQGLSAFLKSQISIINPYKSNKQIVVTNENISEEESSRKNEDYVLYDQNENLLKLSIDEIKVKTRNKITLSLEALTKSSFEGDYSISVKKLLNIETPKTISSNFNHESYDSTDKKIDNVPELRGKIVSGTVLGKKSIAEVENVGVTFSVPKEPNLFNIAITDENGKFFFNLDKPYASDQAFVEIIDSKKYDIRIDTKNETDYSSIEVNPLILNYKYKEEIVERSIQNQIENAFSKVKADSLIPLVEPISNFDDKYLVTYNLDDFTRFQTLKETIVEILAEVRVNKDKESVLIEVKTPEIIVFDNTHSLVLVDGIFVQDHNQLLGFKANKIESINVLKTNFIYNSKKWKGAIFIKTKSEDFESFYKGNYTSLELPLPQYNKKYYSPNYDIESQNIKNVPDFRHQLFWNPNFTFEKKIEKVMFFSSDVKGLFEVSFEGFTLDGKPISLKHTFTVE